MGPLIHRKGNYCGKMEGKPLIAPAGSGQVPDRFSSTLRKGQNLERQFGRGEGGGSRGRRDGVRESRELDRAEKLHAGERGG